jgi:membrane protease YdiL (CAAX protease family)
LNKTAALAADSRLVLGFLFVLASMIALFVLPSQDFVAATFVSMTCMIVATYLLTRYRGLFKPRSASIVIGLVSAAALYLVFYLGNAGIATLHPLGLSASTENSIYSLIASPSNPLYVQVGVLAFDAVGYESFFRGVLQTRLEPRFGVRAPFMIAALDAAIHLVTLNPLWVVTTFIADSSWGLTYHYSKDLTSNTLSHFVWDIVIFIIFPIR